MRSQEGRVGSKNEMLPALWDVTACEECGGTRANGADYLPASGNKSVIIAASGQVATLPLLDGDGTYHPSSPLPLSPR